MPSPSQEQGLPQGGPHPDPPGGGALHLRGDSSLSKGAPFHTPPIPFPSSLQFLRAGRNPPSPLPLYCSDPPLQFPNLTHRPSFGFQKLSIKVVERSVYASCAVLFPPSANRIHHLLPLTTLLSFCSGVRFPRRNHSGATGLECSALQYTPFSVGRRLEKILSDHKMLRSSVVFRFTFFVLFYVFRVFF